MKLMQLLFKKKKEKSVAGGREREGREKEGRAGRRKGRKKEGRAVGGKEKQGQ